MMMIVVIMGLKPDMAAMMLWGFCMSSRYPPIVMNRNSERIPRSLLRG